MSHLKTPDSWEIVYKKAIYAEIEDKNYTLAFDLYNNAIQLGCHKANTNIGTLYLLGHGVEKNILTAINFFNKALDDPFSLLKLADIYSNSIDIMADYKKTRGYYEKIIEMENIDDEIKCQAYTKMAIMYIYGNGVDTIDYVKARDYLNKSIELNNKYGDAYLYLSRICERIINGIMNDEMPNEYEDEKSAAGRKYYTCLMIIELYKKKITDDTNISQKEIDEIQELIRKTQKDADTYKPKMYESIVEEYDKNKLRYDKQIEDYSKELKENLIKAAENGSIEGMYLLGIDYYNTFIIMAHKSNADSDVFESNWKKGMIAPPNERIYWYNIDKATEIKFQNYQPFRPDLEENIKNAVHWLLKSADNGYTPVQYILGELYYHILQDNELAIKYFKKAIENGDKNSLLRMILIYSEQKNMEEANKYGLMYDITIPEYFYTYGLKCYNNADYFAARIFFIKAANEFFAPAQFYLGVIYEKGQGVEKSVTVAINYYKLAAENGYENAQLRLGRMYELGIERYVKQDFDTAIKYYTLASNTLNPIGYLQLGYIYNKKGDYEKSIHNYRLAAYYNSGYGQYYMAIYHYNQGEYTTSMWYLDKVIMNPFGGTFNHNPVMIELMEVHERECNLYISYFARKKIAAMYMKMEGVGAENKHMKQYYTLAHHKSEKIARIMIGRELEFIDMFDKGAFDYDDNEEFKQIIANIQEFTAKQLIEAGFTLQELKDAAFTVLELKYASPELTIQQLKNELKFTAKELKESNFSANELLKDSIFNLHELKEAGFTARELKSTQNPELTIQQLKDLKFSATELYESNFNARDLKTAGFTFNEVRRSPFSHKELSDAGFFADELNIEPLSYLSRLIQ